MKTRNLIIAALLTATYFCFSQDYALCPEGKKSCGPMDAIANRSKIEDGALNTQPYNFILHQEIKGTSTNYGTASFIAPGVLITANHNVKYKFWISTLAYCNKSVDKNKWVYVKKRDVNIYKYRNDLLLTISR